MSTIITCPNCSSQFEPTDAIAQSIEKEMRTKMNAEWQKRKDALNVEKQQIELQQRELVQKKEQQEEELRRRLDQEKKQLEESISLQLKKDIAGEYDTQLKHFQKQIAEKDEKIRTARQIELEAMELRLKLQQQEQEMELKLKRSLMEEREKLQDTLKKEEEERYKLRDQEYQMRMKELEKQLEDQRRLAEEMRRKAEQGSMQLQGEIQELALEALLRNAFPFDLVSEVGKGVRGADCVQTVRNSFGQECGSIMYESKRTKEFSIDWIEKLKADARSHSADVAVIVTQAMPRDMDCFGEKDGVWICSFSEVKALSAVLRDLIIKVHSAARTEENKGDKMQMLYTYLTSREFSEQWKAIREGFMSMKISIQKERDAMERLWKSREKQLEKVLLNAAHIKGSIEGIAGSEEVDLNLTEEDGSLMIES